MALQFCPTCGRYWMPDNKEKAAKRSKQVCSTCKVKVEYSWLGYGILGVLLYALLATSVIPAMGLLAPALLAAIAAVAIYKAIRQRRARNSFEARR